MRTGIKHLTILLFILLLSSCGKNNQPFKSSLNGKMDGTSFTCFNVFSTLGLTTAYVNGSLTGATLELQISTSNATPLTPGQYTISGWNRITYETDTKRYYAGGDLVGGPVHGSGTITITEISNEMIKGIFSGTLLDVTSGMPSGVSIAITDGTFHVK